MNEEETVDTASNGSAQDAGEGTDFYAVANNQVSLTPLQVDLTHNAQLPLIRDWLAQ